MTGKKKVVIAEDHTILREGLKALLASDPDLQVVGEAGDGQEAILIARALKPDLLLLDLSMPRMNGIDAIRDIKQQSPETKILILTVHKAEEYILASLDAGADGYILKDATRIELLLAIKSVLGGKRYLSPEISEKIITGYLEAKRTNRERSAGDVLTTREREIIKLIAEGYKNKAIADYLCVSLKTIQKHRENLMKKLNLHSSSALTAYAMERGIVTR